MPGDDIAEARAAVDQARVLLFQGRCDEAEAHVRPFVDKLVNGPHAALYRAFSRRLQECKRREGP